MQSGKWNKIIIILAIALFSSGCSQEDPDSEGQADNNVSPPEAQSLPTDFIQFYARFHADTAYQLEHIVFPLQGIKADTKEASGAPDMWTRDEWTYHKPLANDDNTYTQIFEQLADGLIVETIRQNNTPFAMQRRFAEMSDGWQLIYYVEMQPVR